MRKYTHLSLFSGIGGHDLAASWAGFTTVGQCEWAEYQTKVLQKHWPDIPRWGDIKTLNAENFYERTGLRTVDLVSGSPPCQPFSVAGKQRGKADDRYLWPEMYRIIREIQPAWVLLEEVTGFIPMALDTVLSDLEAAEYASQSFVIPACGVNAPHQRYRLCVVAHAIHGSGAMRRHRELQNAQIHAGSGDYHRGRTEGTFQGKWRESEPGISSMADGLRTLVDGHPSPDTDSNGLQRRKQLSLLDADGLELFTECSCREREREHRGYDGVLRSLMEVTPWGRLGPMNVEYLEYMMGYPIGYTALNTSGMMESRKA
jgi:site-specific DNA-cytosine methylase